MMMQKLRILSLLFAVLAAPIFAAAGTLVGVVQNIDEEGVVTGWAYDKSNPDQNVEVHFYAGPMTSLVGKAPADNSHPVTGSGPHWFAYKLPAQLRPAHGDNSLYVYAVSPTDLANSVQLLRAGSTTPYVYGDLSKIGGGEKDK